MKKVAGIITMRGGRTCHAAIVSRELNIPAIVGVENVQKVLKQGQEITLDCSQGDVGYIYDGALQFKEQKIAVHQLPKSPVSLLVNIAQPDTAFTVSQLPVDGVGLARIEFIIANSIKIHPLALIEFNKVRDKKIKKKIERITALYKNKEDFFIDTLAQGIGMIAAAFYPKPVIVRTSDFKTNEYRDLLGGSYFEPFEENPMLGLRGASRYIHPDFQQAFALECKALKKVRATMGLTNVISMIPFVRTVDEAEKVCTLLKAAGIEKKMDGSQLFMMCELPANVLLIDQFSEHFDGFSLGSNDLTQLILGVDRDSPLVASLFDERNPAVTLMLQQAIDGAKRAKRKIGICGQAPSDYPEIAQKLINYGIDSISLNQDAVIPFLMRLKKGKTRK
jgi:pyruvate, water dikinase